jgi:tetratricopeptide (TPR) repeat protein
MPPPRELADDYRLEKILSSSRGGSILRASRLDTGETVTIKLIHVPAAADASLAGTMAARFAAYAGALAGLRHPNLPVVLDSGLTPDGGAFLVMETLEGVALDAHQLGADASPDRILPLLAQALDGLEELARHGLAHLNVSPGNLFLVPEAAGEDAPQPQLSRSPRPRQPSHPQHPPRVKLLGLGTALFHVGEPWPEAESARFRAPELAAPPEAAPAMPDWRADCYALALTACNALGATVAFGEASGAIVQMPLALSFELANDEALRQILERCLRRAPWERPAHAAIREAFDLAVGGLATAGGAVLIEHLGEDGEVGGTGPSDDVVPLPAALPGTAPAPWSLAELIDPEPSLFGAQLSGSAAHLGSAHAREERDWRSALEEPGPPSRPLPWQPPPPSDRSSEPLPAAEPSGDPAGGTGGDSAGGTGGDSLLELFDVPESLPEIDEAGDLAAGPDAWFGLHLPADFEPEAADPSFAAHPGAGSEWPGEPPAASPGLGEPQPAGATPFPATAASPASVSPVPPLPPIPPVSPKAATLEAPQSGAPRLEAPRFDAVPVAAPQPAAHPTAAAPTSPASAAPAASPQPAAPQGELLSAVDELLSPLPPPLLPPIITAAPAARAASGAPGTPGTPGNPGAAASSAAALGQSEGAAAGKGGALAFVRALPRPALLGGAGALLLAVAVGAFVLVGHGSRQPAATAGAAGGTEAPPPPPRPGRSAAAKFFDAKSYLILGRDSDQRVRQALRELTFADQGQLGEQGCRQLRAIQQTLAAAALETLQRDLASGLRSGDLGALESVVEVASDSDVPQSQKSDLARARSLVKLYELAQAAAAAGDHARALEQFHAMEAQSRALHDPLELRDKAAAALEADAGDLAHDGKYDEALSRLDPILRSWPERTGIRDLAKSYVTAAAHEKEQLAILDSLPGIERRRKPSEGLDLLRPLTPTPHLEQRIAEARQRLEAQLAQLDAQPPQVVLRDGYVLDYSRGTVVTLSFRVTDDYLVKSVKLYARPESGGVREMPLQKDGMSYTVAIPPSFHENGTVEFFVVATDLSGHEGRLGSKEGPLRLKRRQGFERLLH